ncbi:hypothetical protein ACHAPJ_009579 [Fusarium lateritium]
MVPPLCIELPRSLRRPGDDQNASPFFGKLNADVRHLTYKELFGLSRVYIMFTSPAVFDRYSGPVFWRHRIREDSRKVPHRFSRQTQSSSRLQGINLMFSCKKAYHEGVAVLYGSNTMVFESPEQYLLFKQTFEHNVTKFKSHEFYCPFRSAVPQDVPDLDLLTHALGNLCFRSLRADVYLWGVEHEEFYFEDTYSRSAKKQAKKQIIQALKRLLSVGGLRGRVFLPAQLEDAAREMAQNHTGKVFFTFHQEETVYEDYWLTQNEVKLGGYRLDRRGLMGISELDNGFAGDNKDEDADNPQAFLNQRF